MKKALISLRNRGFFFYALPILRPKSSWTSLNFSNNN